MYQYAIAWRFSLVNLLFVEASPRREAATSSKAADIFIDALKRAHGAIEVDHLDLWKAALPEFDGDLIAAKYAKLAAREMSAAEAGAWQRIAALTGRFAAADAMVIATPMWNFGIPYKLKHWIDLITQPGLTFTFDPEIGYAPIVRSRPTLVILSSAGDYREGPSYGRPDLATPYMNEELRFLGLAPVLVEKIGPTTGPQPLIDAAKRAAVDRLEQLAPTFLDFAA